jgi:SAM-dependent methyltransferase
MREFEKMYVLGGEGSGPGSTIAATELYRTFLENFFQEQNIKCVLDYGCGDWQFSSHINWGNVMYYGCDEVDFLIERLKHKFESDKRKFFVASTDSLMIPEGVDLILIKDVVQHLAYEEIHRLIRKFKKAKHVLWTNDTTDKNTDIERGDWRHINLELPPFELIGKNVLSFNQPRSDNRKVTFWTQSVGD